MKIDITSFFVNSSIVGASATAAWATSIGQRKGNDCRIENDIDGIDDLLKGMIYKSMERSCFDVSKGSSNREIILISKFDKVFINDELIDGASFALMIVRELSDSHYGRLLLSYPRYITYLHEPINENTIKEISKVLGCEDTGCWFISEINIVNQDQLYLKGHVVDKKHHQAYECTSAERSKIWHAIVEKDNNK